MTCLLCGSDQFKPFAEVTSFGYPLVYYQCDRCGLIFQSEDEVQAADPAFYATTYRQIYQANAEPTPKDLWVQRQRAKHLVEVMDDQLADHPRNVLDIGASAGILLDVIRTEWGCQVTGVEPGDAYRTFASQKGIPMFPSLESLIESQPDRFDLISLSHVLEHLTDPVGMLRLIREALLTQDGTLLLEVPNFYAHDSYELAHLACFTPHTLKTVIQQAGYVMVSLKKHGVPRSDCLSLYLTLVARPSPAGRTGRSLRRETRVKLKRAFGMFYRRLVQKLLPQKAWRSLPDELRP